MRWPDDTYLAAAGSWLPEPTPVADAVAAGAVDAARVAGLDYASVCLAEDVAPPVMAARAAATALGRAGLTGRDLSLLLHCSIWFQGVDIWPAASYVADGVGSPAPALDLQQRCNGSLAALELALAHVHAGSADAAALITTADRFAPPAVDRWAMHGLSVYGDGGTALVVGRRGGFARVLATATVADNSVEGLTRGDADFAVHSTAAQRRIDLVARGEEYFTRADATRTQMRVMRTISRAATLACRDAGVKVGDLRRVVCAASGRFDEGAHFHTLIGAREEVLTWDFGRTTGHIGTGDWFAGLEYLVTAAQVDPGDRVLLLGGGAGYTCTAVVLDVLSVPDWSAAGRPDPELVEAS